LKSFTLSVFLEKKVGRTKGDLALYFSIGSR